MEYLIREELFNDLHWSLLLLITAVSMAVLIKGADWLVEGASGLALRLGMPKVIIGATIVSLGTTSPEAAVSVMAAWSGDAGLALGNAVGSIIADTALIFGVGALLVALPADRFVLNRQGWVQFGAGVLLAVICYVAFATSGDQAVIGRTVGVVFLVLLVAYLIISVRWARQHSQGEPFQTPEDVADGLGGIGAPSVVKFAHSLAFLICMLVAGLVLVVLASQVLINAVSELAMQIGVSKAVIAATLVAFGTSLPELMVGIMAIRKKHGELLVGNVIGADVLNVLFVIGASAVASSLPLVDPETSGSMQYSFLWVQVPIMLLVLVLFRIFIFRAVRCGKFARWNGLPLVAIYVLFLILLGSMRFSS